MHQASTDVTLLFVTTFARALHGSTLVMPSTQKAKSASSKQSTHQQGPCQTSTSLTATAFAVGETDIGPVELAHDVDLVAAPVPTAKEGLSIDPSLLRLGRVKGVPCPTVMIGVINATILPVIFGLQS